ncbi:MAG: hypothetical protein AAFQ01_01875, partial [Bacteroidota bacterium]
MAHRHYFWILFLLFHNACDRCIREAVPFDDGDWGAVVAINNVRTTGSINGSPVLRLSGKITQNVPGAADPILGAVFMTQGQRIETLASAMQKHQVKPKDAKSASSKGPVMNVLFPLSAGNFVNYERVERTKKGPVAFDVSSLDPDRGLASNTAYNVSLFIKIGPHVFYTAKESVSYTTPNRGEVAQVVMQEAKCRHGYNSTGLWIDFTMQAEVKKLSKGGKAGFLLIERREKKVEPLDVLEEHLGAGKNKSIFGTTNNKFAKHGDGVIVCCA